MRKMDNGATNIATLGPEQIKNFHQTLLTNVFAQKLEQNKRQIETLNDYKKRHEKVIEGLQVYPLSVSENCMVPIGKRALMKGKLTHTNEILVCLGDGYFAKYSAPQAMLLCNRRIAWADKMLKDLEAERNLYEMRQILPLQHDLFGDGDRKDLWEYWDEDQLDEWRVLHRQREKEYRQKLAKLREQEKTDICTDEDLLKRLDDLEEEEELREIYRLEAKLEKPLRNDLEKGEVYDESEEDDTSDSDEITSKKMEEKLQKLQNILIDKYIKDMSKKYVSCEVTRDATLDKNEQTSPAAHSSQDRLKRNYSSVFDEWRVFKVLHRLCEKECRQKLAKLRKQEKTDIRAEEDLLKRLDDLEKEEELRDKIYRLEAELEKPLRNDLEKGEVYDKSEEDDTSDSDEITSEKMEEKLQKLNILIDKYIKNASKKYDSFEVTRDATLDKNEQISPAAHSSQDRLKRNYSSVFDEWRVFTILHRQHEKKYRQKLAKLREQEKTDIRAEEDLLKRLDEDLEEGQKLRDKIYRLEAELEELLTNDLEKGEIYDESEEDDTSDSDEITSEKIEEELQKLKNIQIDKYIKNTSKKYVSCEVTQDEILDKNEQISPAAHSSQDRLKENYSSEHLGNVSEDTSLKKRRVSFVEPCAIENDTKEEISQKSCSVLKQNYTHDEDSKEVDDIIQIEFLHSSCTPNIPESNTTEIQSPTDIYKMFTPKSILKRSPNDVNQIALPLDEDSTTETEDEDDYVKPSAYISVIKEVQENEVSTKNTLEKKDEKKIVSKFKLERAARKK